MKTFFSFLPLASVKIFSNLLLDSSHFVSFQIVSSDGIRSAPRTVCIFSSSFFRLPLALMLRRTYIDCMLGNFPLFRNCTFFSFSLSYSRHAIPYSIHPMTLLESFPVQSFPLVDYVPPPQSIC